MSHSLTGITIQPSTGNTIVVPGVSAQFKAIGFYTESGHATVSQDITSQVTWSSTIPDVASINSSGLATGVAPGTTSIIASIPGAFGNLTATSNIVVNDPTGSGGSGTTTRTLTSVTVIPGSQTLNVTGQSAQLIAMGSYTVSPTSSDLTNKVSWVSSDTSVAQVSRSGLVTAMGTGTATISALATAPDGSQLSGSAAISVTSGQNARTLTALNITPGSQTLPLNQTADFLVIGSYNTSPVSADLTTSATWRSSDTSVATVSAGVVTAVGPGTAAITAEANATDGSVITTSGTVTVVASTSGTTRTLTSLSIIPLTQTVGAVGETGQFLAIGTYSATPLTVDLTDQVQWLSSDVQVGTINSAGL
ncbi:MAG: Ig-like domain-containing protein, partial [Acidobacteriaceae bacterium]|nr:Ig-like domain-containing protein [Acidobacteriaceae bacterium]